MKRHGDTDKLTERGKTDFKKGSRKLKDRKCKTECMTHGEDKTYKTKQETLKLEPKTLSEQLSDGKLVSATLDIGQLYYLVFVCIKQARHNNIICELASFRCLACYVKLIA